MKWDFFAFIFFFFLSRSKPGVVNSRQGLAPGVREQELLEQRLLGLAGVGGF